MDIKIKSQLKAECFSTLFQNLRIFTDSISIHFKKTGVYVQTMDAARVSIIELNLPKEWFDEYTITHPTDIILGINSSIMYKILNARDKTQRIQILYESSQPDTLSVYFTEEEKSTFNKSFNVPLIDLESDIMTIPNIDYEAEFSIPSNIFTSLIHQLKTFGDSLDINCSEESIVMTSNSIDCGKMNVEIKIDDLSSFSIVEDSALELAFSLIYLNNICSFNKLAKDMEIKLCNQYPMCIIFPLADEGELKMFLAPKMGE